MSLAAALIYWVIVALWLAILATVCVAFVRNPRTFGTTRLLLAVVAIDTSRNIVENLYFGLYFGGQYGLFPAGIVGVLGHPSLLIIPKLINVAAACVVLSLMLWRWLPMAQAEREDADDLMRETSEALRLEAEEHRRLLQTSADLIVVTDRNRVILRISASCREVLGYEPSELIGRYGGDFVAPEDVARLQAEFAEAVGGLTIRNFQTRYIHKSGRLVTLGLTGVWSPEAERFFLIGRDMTERLAAEERLRHLAHFDQLTGLPNRISLMADLQALLAAPGQLPPPAIAMIDLDGFKDINDTLGHAIGDRLLAAVAARLAAASAGHRQAYRLGGDEFLIVFRSPGDATHVAAACEAVLHQIEQPFEVEGHRLFLGASIGVALAPTDGADAEQLLASADLALYDAKAAGGRRYSLFRVDMRTEARARQQMDTELRRASAEGEFVLYYQPQIRLSDGALVGVEALLRWRHPLRGLIGPGQFIEVLAQSPAAAEAGRWILTTACRTAARWRAAGANDLRIGVNLFAAQIHNGRLVADVESALAESGLPAAALELEITENIALGHDEAILAALRHLQAQGVGLAFDDFGTGYASLSYLMRFPLTRIKIDQSFVGKIRDDARSGDTAIVRSIIVMAHNLGLEVIAEGVETTAQAEYLKQLTCDEAQGFLYARPLPEAEFEAFMATYLKPAPDGWQPSVGAA